jgi:hypothetical protein
LGGLVPPQPEKGEGGQAFQADHTGLNAESRHHLIDKETFNMAKYRDLFHRSEYQIALQNYRRARRRGDVVDAQRWIKLADMHLRVADRFDEGVHADRIRDAELRAPPHAPKARDPNGFSPSGIPNWLLDRRARERSGQRSPPEQTR